MDEFPLFSIIIPTYNRPQQLASCLESMTHLNYQKDRFEIIIVDDGSLCPLDAVVTSFKEQFTLELIRQDNAGPAFARNTGAVQARGQFLAFIDDDCQSQPNWLQILATRFNDHPEALLGGHTINQLTENIYAEASQLLLDYLYSYYNSQSNSANFFTSNNMALPKDKFHQTGGFDTTFSLAAGEDREFCDRWLHQGYKMVYVPEVTVYHSHRLTLRTFCRQHFNYGRGAFCFHQARAKRTNKPIKVERLHFYLNLLGYPFIQKSNQPGILLMILFLVSQITNVVGFFLERSVRSQHTLKGRGITPYTKSIE